MSKIATREAYGKALSQLTKENKKYNCIRC